MDIEARNEKIKQLRVQGKTYGEIGEEVHLPSEKVRDIVGVPYKVNARKHKSDLRLRIKKEVLTHYGKGKLVCVHCGFADVRALTIDHVTNNGAQDRKQGRKSGIWLYSWLKSHNYPLGYQTLCFNCQWIKRISLIPKIKFIWG